VRAITDLLNRQAWWGGWSTSGRYRDIYCVGSVECRWSVWIPRCPAGRASSGSRSGDDDDDAAAAARAVAQDDDLAQSLTALSRLSSSRLSLEDLLTQVATFAVQAIPGADGAGLTLIEVDRADTIVKSAPFVRGSTTSSTASVRVRVSPRLRPA